MKKGIKVFCRMIITLCVFVVLAGNIVDASSIKSDISDSEYFNVINLYDINDNLTYKKFFDLDGSLTRLKKMNKDLNSNFDFVELSFQSLEYLGYYNEDKSFSRSSKNFDATNQKVQIDGKETYVTPLKTVQLGKTIFSEMKDKISEGISFTDKDFEFSYGISIPVILGAEYESIYKLNDTFSLEYLQNIFEFKVIGFFNKGANIVINQNKTILDNYICMPYFNIEEEPTDDKYHLFQQRYYFQKNDGFIKISNQNIDKDAEYKLYKNKLNQIAKENSLLYDLASARISIKLDF